MLEMLSDGTLIVRGRVRPAGTQDESFRHTRWGRTDRRHQISSEWLTAWQHTYRYIALEMIDDWSVLR